MNKEIAACAFQLGPLSTSKEKNIAKCLDLLRKAYGSKSHLDYALFPELCTTPFFAIGVRNKEFFNWAETLEGPSIQRFKKAAKEFGVNIILPFFEKGELKGRYFNSAAVISSHGDIVEGVLPDGSKIPSARKNYISEYSWDSGYNNEKLFFSPGSGHPTFNTAYGKIGILICYERWFTEAWRVLALNGAEIIFNPNASSGYVSKMFVPLLRANAAQNCVFAVSCNKAGIEKVDGEQARYYGMSCISDPTGNILAQAPEYSPDKVAKAKLDLSQVEKQRRSFFVYRDRRPELYDSLVKR